MRWRTWHPYLPIMPSAVFLLLLFAVPLAQALTLAFTTPSGIGLRNFAQMLDDLDFAAGGFWPRSANRWAHFHRRS
jgi:ABC-type sugar transport system permease subunit